VSARHKRQRKSFIQNSRLSKITVAVAGVTIIVPAAVAASVATSGGSAGHGSSLMAMAGSHPAARSGPVHLDAGIPMTDAARGEVGKLGVERVVTQRAAEQAADRRAAKRAAARRAADRQAAATPRGATAELRKLRRLGEFVPAAVRVAAAHRDGHARLVRLAVQPVRLPG
jgi:hypothetical protein